MPVKAVSSHLPSMVPPVGKRYSTHLGRILEDLGIRMISAYSPQAKSHVERGFGVLQDNYIRLDGLMIDAPLGRNRRGYAKAKVMKNQHLDGC